MIKRTGSFMGRLQSFRLAAGLTALITGCGYLLIAPTRLSSANMGLDAGDFLAAALTGGIPHPTGYPTHTLLNIVFQLIPISTPVFRGVLASLIPAALGAGLMALWIGYLLEQRTWANWTAALATGLTWGTTPLLVSQAVMVEVHGLQSLFVILVIWWMTLTLRAGSNPQRGVLLLLSLVIGLACGNHVTIVLLAPVVVFCLVIAVRNGLPWRFVLAEGLCVLLGLLVYLYLPVRAHAWPPVNWGNPQTLDGFLWDLTAQPYRGLLFGASPDLFWDRVRTLPRFFLDQFGWLGVAAGVAGAILGRFRLKWLRWVCLWIFVIYLLFGIGYNTRDYAVYLLPSLLVVAVWIGLAIPLVWGMRWRKIPAGILLSLAMVAGILIRIPRTLANLDTRARDQQARFAELLLGEAPGNAIIFTSVTEDTFPVWYYHFGLKLRPDVRVVVMPLTQFVWYQQVLVHLYPDLDFAPVNSTDVLNIDWGMKIPELNPARSICKSRLTPDTELGYDFSCTTP